MPREGGKVMPTPALRLGMAVCAPGGRRWLIRQMGRLPSAQSSEAPLVVVETVVIPDWPSASRRH